MFKYISFLISLIFFLQTYSIRAQDVYDADIDVKRIDCPAGYDRVLESRYRALNNDYRLITGNHASALFLGYFERSELRRLAREHGFKTEYKFFPKGSYFRLDYITCFQGSVNGVKGVWINGTLIDSEENYNGIGVDDTMINLNYLEDYKLAVIESKIRTDRTKDRYPREIMIGDSLLLKSSLGDQYTAWHIKNYNIYTGIDAYSSFNGSFKVAPSGIRVVKNSVDIYDFISQRKLAVYTASQNFELKKADFFTNDFLPVIKGDTLLGEYGPDLNTVKISPIIEGSVKTETYNYRDKFFLSDRFYGYADNSNLKLERLFTIDDIDLADEEDQNGEYVDRIGNLEIVRTELRSWSPINIIGLYTVSIVVTIIITLVLLLNKFSYKHKGAITEKGLVIESNQLLNLNAFTGKITEIKERQSQRIFSTPGVVRTSNLRTSNYANTTTTTVIPPRVGSVTKYSTEIFLFGFDHKLKRTDFSKNLSIQAYEFPFILKKISDGIVLTIAKIGNLPVLLYNHNFEKFNRLSRDDAFDRMIDRHTSPQYNFSKVFKYALIVALSVPLFVPIFKYISLGSQSGFYPFLLSISNLDNIVPSTLINDIPHLIINFPVLGLAIALNAIITSFSALVLHYFIQKRHHKTAKVQLRKKLTGDITKLASNIKGLSFPDKLID